MKIKETVSVRIETQKNLALRTFYKSQLPTAWSTAFRSVVLVSFLTQGQMNCGIPMVLTEWFQASGMRVGRFCRLTVVNWFALCSKIRW